MAHRSRSRRSIGACQGFTTVETATVIAALSTLSVTAAPTALHDFVARVQTRSAQASMADVSSMGVSVTVVRSCSIDTRPHRDDLAAVTLQCAGTDARAVRLGSGMAAGASGAGIVYAITDPAQEDGRAVRMLTIHF